MIQITYEIARAIAADKANLNMKTNGRSKWNREDYNVAIETFNKLYLA